MHRSPIFLNVVSKLETRSNISMSFLYGKPFLGVKSVSTVKLFTYWVSHVRKQMF